MSERFCPTGNHFRKIERFRKTSAGRPARDCEDCERAIRDGRKTSIGGRIISHHALDGVDIDAIHRKFSKL